MSFAAVTSLCGALVLPPMMEDAAIRWGLASAMGAALAALAAAWGHGFATRPPQVPAPTPPGRSAHASAPRSAAVAGDNSGSISTGDAPAPTPPTPAVPAAGQPPAPPAPGTASASGERSIAIGGNNSGPLSTGDQPGSPNP
ncbi:hypothetical protein ACFU5Y_33245 [Streptomyces gardneri]|uniref:hypothetical protein n=1 Tax=Streptomyces gardneri TaxID=66892 RepID=UPI003673D7B5